MNMVDVLRTVIAWVAIAAFVVVIIRLVVAWFGLLGRRPVLGAALMVPVLVAIGGFTGFIWNFLVSSDASLDNVGNHQVVEEQAKQ